MWLWAALVLILSAALVLAGWFFGSGPGALVTVPDVEGHSRATAEDTLRASGVAYTLAGQHHDLVAADSVITTDPTPGSEIRRFTTVHVTVSEGPELLGVPDLAGLDREAAHRALAEAGLSPGAVRTEHSDAVGRGRVLRQDPAAGELLRRHHGVSVVVSAGPEPVDVPDVRGLAVGEAAEALRARGLRLEVAGSEHSADVEAGRISAQESATGAVAPGTAVSVLQSRGPVMVAVPDVTGLAADDARRVLEEAGLRVEERRVLGGLLGDRGGRVRTQDPAAGTESAEGSTVRLLVL